MQSETSQSITRRQESQVPRVVEFIETQSRMWLGVVWGRERRKGDGELLLNGYKVSILQDGKSFGDG